MTKTEIICKGEDMELIKSQPIKLYDFVWESLKNDRYRIVINSQTRKKTLQVW